MVGTLRELRLGFVEAKCDQPLAVPEQGRYAFTAIPTWATVCAAAAAGLGRARTATVAAVLLTAMLGLSVASQLLALGGFYT